MKTLLAIVILLATISNASPAQQSSARAVAYSDAFKTLDDALGYIRYVLEKPQVVPGASIDNRVTTVTIDSNSLEIGPLTDENIRFTYRFHAVTEVVMMESGAVGDSVAVTGVDIVLESQFHLLDLLMYNPVLEKSSGGLAGIELKLSVARPSEGEIGSYVVLRDGRRTARPKDRIGGATEKVLLVCYIDADRIRIANAFYQAQHIARTRNRLNK